MSEKTREICTVVSQESIGAGIYSMWIQTDRIAADAKPGQFVSLYTNDKSKILPRPISLCEIDKENGRLHLVYKTSGPILACSWRDATTPSLVQPVELAEVLASRTVSTSSSSSTVRSSTAPSYSSLSVSFRLPSHSAGSSI